MKHLFVAEKPSVALEFAKAMKISTNRKNGYIEGENTIITWCVGHLVSMSYPEKYDEKYKRWSLDTLPFLPDTFQYEVIPSVLAQYNVVSSLLRREDIACIYICTDSGREGEYIYRLVADMAGVLSKKHKRVWIDSQTEEEILRGIKEAKDWKEYDSLAASAYLRAKEDYLMGINFSRVLTLKYGQMMASVLGREHSLISVGRVMTCVIGMVVRREREIRDFIKTPFYKIIANLSKEREHPFAFDAEWRAVDGSKFADSPKLYKENGFKDKKDADALIQALESGTEALVLKKEKKKEKKAPPLLYNLAELQNECSKRFKISPDETLKVVQELYEKKLVTYPRTDARVLSTAVAKTIIKNISGLQNLGEVGGFAKNILEHQLHKNLLKSKYVNDKQITDHYAIIPTGMSNVQGLKPLSYKIYDLIVRRFLAIFYPPAEYEKYILEVDIGGEHFFSNFKICIQRGYLTVLDTKKEASDANVSLDKQTEEEAAESIQDMDNPAFKSWLDSLKKASVLHINSLSVKEGETAAPKRYSSGSMILAMENAGQLIEDEDLRSQIKGSGIGTSATRAEILKKLFANQYLYLNKKTQIITPTLYGEMIYEVVFASMKQLLNPELTASWEKGLAYVSEGSITSEEYMKKLEDFVRLRVQTVLHLNNQSYIRDIYRNIEHYYK